MRQISLCLTHWNRAQLIPKSYEKVFEDQRISEIVISDDHSDYTQYLALLGLRSERIHIYRNPTNLGVGGNKAQAIALAQNQWCIIFDSDNVLDSTYIDKLFEIPNWEPDTIYAPSFAKPHFDYRLFQGKTIDKTNVREYVGRPGFDCFLNTGNYFVHRDTFNEVYEHIQVKGADSIYILYLWLKAGKKIVAVPGMHYEHLVHNGSYYQSVAKESEPLTKHYEKLIKEL
jgi:glycosyltransferase involved in cell wall biosynthesis